MSKKYLLPRIYIWVSLCYVIFLILYSFFYGQHFNTRYLIVAPIAFIKNPLVILYSQNFILGLAPFFLPLAIYYYIVGKRYSSSYCKTPPGESDNRPEASKEKRGARIKIILQNIIFAFLAITTLSLIYRFFLLLFYLNF